MAALAIAQDEKGWLAPEVMDDVADYLGMPPIAVYEVATFYKMYKCSRLANIRSPFAPICLARCPAAKMLRTYLKQKLGIDFNETTADGQFTLKEGECMGPAATRRCCW